MKTNKLVGESSLHSKIFSSSFFKSFTISAFFGWLAESKKAHIEFKIILIPIRSVPQSTGIKLPSVTPCLNALEISSFVKGSSSKYFSSNSSLVFATASSIIALIGNTSSIISSGIGATCVWPFSNIRPSIFATLT